VITLSAMAGLLAQMPAGALIDRTRNKRGVVVAAAVAVTLSCVALPFVQGFALVAATQSLAGVAGAVFPPALAAITLGVVGPRAFARRIGRNEGFNHAGNAAAAALAAGTTYLFGPVVVFWIMAGLALASIGAVLAIPASAIDDDAVRGLGKASGGPRREQEEPSAWRSLLTCRPLLVFAALMALFHLANAAMLPTVGQKLTHVVGSGHATSLIAGCIVAAQCVMVPVAVLVGRKADAWGRKPFFLAAFGVLALRGLLALHPVGQSLLAAGRAAAGRDGGRHLRRAVSRGGGGPDPGHRPLQRQPGRGGHRPGHRRRAERHAGRHGDRGRRLFGRLSGAGHGRGLRLPRVSAADAGNAAGARARPAQAVRLRRSRRIGSLGRRIG
jgi:MFS family permease